MDRRTTKTTHYSLVALICVLIVTFALGMGGVAAAGQNSTNGDVVSGFTKVGNFDMETLRQQYFNQTAVQETTASYSGKRWVIVELEGDSLFTSYENKGYAYGDFATYCNSVEAQLLKSDIEASHRDFLATLDDNRFDYSYKYSYSTLNNGVALKVDADTFNEIKKLDGVKSVYYSESYSVPTVAVSNNANVYTTGIYDSSNLNYKGEGMVVAVLDTGLDYSHEAFATMPTNPAWSKEDVAAKMAASTRFNAQATVDDVYYNAKVPYAYDYADDDSDVYPSYSTHGTHVAGIVAGKSDYVVNKETGETFVGVAPEAQLVICKVFTDNLDSDSLGGADTIDIIAAVSDCVELGVDVINMSLGSSAGFSDEKSDELINEVYNRVRAAGISLVVAASNDYSSGFGGGNGTNLASNPDSGTVGSPSTYGAALSVASINGQKATFVQANEDENQVAFITESSDANGNEYDFVDRLYTIAGKSKGQTLNYKYVVVGGVGRATNYTAKIRRELQDKAGYDGTIALIKRGDNTFAEKVQNAMDNGADAVIIYNNLSGTIRMSLGDVNDPVPTCSIPMDAGKVFVEKADKGVGSIQINSEFKAGPFMSDFSSWGPTPDLQLKPEITAHGGEITSAVPGGYDVYSGTSMAAPNMSGAVALLRQYLKTANPTLTGVELNARVNQVLMSTATIALNDEGNPYSPRKQGAGLAGIADAINAESFITVKDKDGNVRDKTKIELYDDKTKTGIYEFEFTINNISGRVEEYDPTVYVMTETLASDNKTVAEKAHMLSDSTIEYFVDGARHTGHINVGANMTTTVKVRITLSQAAREYLDKSFENGMYVEGFVSLKGVDATKVTIGLPYLAFYGDWTAAPLFDYSTYELAESQKDTNVPAEDKLVASAADTKIIGMYFDDKYILQLGAYLYEMEDSDVKIYPEKEKAAVSMFDNKGQRTIYEVYMVYAGLLRGAAYMNVEIKDAATGQVIYTERQENISKSYAAGGSNRAAAITLEIKPSEWNLLNNGTYYVSLKGELDYPGGENPKRNSFDFQFTVDYEAPQMLDYRIRYESYTENKKTKYRIYMDVDVIDNQFVQDVMPCYVKTEKGQNTLTLLTEHPIPVYGGQGQKSTVSFDITDIYEDYIKTGKMYIAVEDYAMNQATYVINAKAGLDYPESVTIGDPDGRLVDTEAESEYPIYELEIKQNELFSPTITTLPDASMSQTLSWYVAKGSSVVAVNNEEIFGLAQGKATIYLKDGAVISAEDVPGALADTDFAFLGWFVGDVAYDSSVAVTSNIVVNAKFSTFFKSYFGTWHGATDDWDAVAYTVVVDATSINVTIGSADAQAATSIEVDEDGTVMFKLGETDYMLYEYYDGNLHIIDTAEIALSAELAGRVHVSSSDIVGTYTTEGGHTIVINKTFVKVDGVLGTGFYYSNYNGYSWSIGDNYSSLAYDSSAQAWIYKENYNSEDDKLIVPELVAIDIPAEFVGNWYGTVESFGATSYFLVKVTADGVFAYTPSTGYAKVGVATDYKDGALTIVGLDETITASIVDGKLKYTSDSAYGADYELTKGTVVVFEHEYSVYYIATVGADGKIDQDTFALEDPQVAAGYTFKGWLSDLDYVTEFDEDATFAESAVFQSNVEKTGYVLTFKKSSSDSDPIIVVVEKSVGKLTADQIPAALTYEDGSVFTGWYTAKGVQAVADLAITADTTFIAASVKESDYEGYWINTTSGKEALAVIADGKVSFGYSVNGLAYAFSTEDGSLSFSVKDSYSILHRFTIIKTSSGITVTESYYDRDAEENVSVEYELATPKSSSLAKTCAGTYQCSNSEIITVLENGVVTKVDGVATTYGYISGSASSIKITYKTGSSSSVTTKTGKYDAKSLVLGGKIYVKNPSSFASYYNSSNGTFYAYARDGKETIYTYKGTDYATIDGELAVGNIVTVTYGDKSFVAKITSATAYDVAGAERGTFTAEGKDSITFDGFGSATIGDKTYTYIINAKNVVVLTGETTLGVTLDSEAMTYADATGDGFVHAYTDASNSRYTLTFDGFGGVEYKYASTYGSPQIAYGSYTLGNGTVTVSGANYSYNKTYTVEESGSVIASTDGSKVLAVAGYVVESKIEQFKGYWVNGSDTIEITLDSSNNAIISINGGDTIKAKANWNGSVLTFTAADSDNSNETYAKFDTTYTLKVVDGKLVVSHKCAIGIDEEPIYADTDTVVNYEVGSKAGDGFEGTYKSSKGDVIVLDGKGNGTYTSSKGEFKFTYTVSGTTLNLSNFSFYDDDENTLTVTADGLKADFSGDYGNYSLNDSFTKEAEETLDEFAGTWSGKVGYNNLTVVCDGKGNIKVGDNSYTYTITDGKIVVGDYTFTKSGDAIKAVYDDGDYNFDGTLTKQA